MLKRVVEFVGRLMACEYRGIYEVDWDKVAEGVYELGLNWPEVRRKAEAVCKRILEEERMPTLSAWMKAARKG